MKKGMTIEIEETLYQELEDLAQHWGTKLEEALEQVIKTYLEQRHAYISDSFFQLGRAGQSGLGDLAKSHDKYLYSDEMSN